MSKYIEGTPIKLTCSEQAFPEFPDLLFGKTTDGITVFDATHYLQKQSPASTLDEFFAWYEVPIVALQAAYSISEGKIHFINEDGHHLIESNFVYLFIAFVEPSFWGYMFDRIHDMFSNGFCVSDSYILSLAQARLPKEVLIQAMNEQN